MITREPRRPRGGTSGMRRIAAAPVVKLPIALVIALLVASLVGGCAVLDGPDEPFTDDPAASVGPAPTLLPGAQEPVAVATATPAASQDNVLHGSFRRGGVPVPPSVLADAERICRSIPTSPTVNEIGSKPIVVSDLRGQDVVLLVFADDLGATGCRVRFGTDGSTSAGFFDVKGSTKDALADDDLTLGAIWFLEDGTSQYVLAAGRVGQRAAKVRAGFDDDTYVTATIHDGWWAMWWPGQTKPAVIVAANAKNEAIATVDAP